jgi:2-oxoisovalerate dehydrogenase E2 component (dihydrolipoyl transacylase)
VQSDKASVEITSPYDGTVKEILVQEGQVAKVGEGLCIIEVDEEEFDSSDAPTSEPPPVASTSSGDVPPPRQEQAPETPSDKRSAGRRPHPLDPNASPASESAPIANAAATKDVLALPSVRHFARENGVDVALLSPGSGKDGRVERADVERYLAGGKSLVEQPPAASPSPPAEGDIIVELGRTRYGMWKAMEKVRTFDIYLFVLRCLIFGCGAPSLYRAWKYHTLGEQTVAVLLCTADTHIVIRPPSI